MPEYAALKEFDTCVSQRVNVCVIRISKPHDQQETDASRKIGQLDTRMGNLSIDESDGSKSGFGSDATANIPDVMSVPNRHQKALRCPTTAVSQQRAVSEHGCGIEEFHTYCNILNIINIRDVPDIR